jgi:Family of unknown function (DUF6262)
MWREARLVTPRRASALGEAAAARSTGAAERARRALVELDRRAATITFAVVAQAGVSRQFLYSHPDLRADIELLRGRQRAPARLPARERPSDESIRVRLRVALDEHKRLRDEIAALREELALGHGRVRELELAARARSAGCASPARETRPAAPPRCTEPASARPAPDRSGRRSLQAKGEANLDPRARPLSDPCRRDLLDQAVLVLAPLSLRLRAFPSSGSG